MTDSPRRERKKMKPRFSPARLLLHAALPKEWRADLMGDIEELYRRKRRKAGRLPAWIWYWRHGLDLVIRFALERLRRPIDCGVPAGTTSRQSEVVSPAGWLTALDLKLAFRMMLKTPWLTIVAVAAMAVGIGLATAAFSLARATLSAQLPFPDGDRIYRVQDLYLPGGYPIRVEPSVFEHRRRSFSSFEGLAGFESRRVSLGHSQQASQVVRLGYVTTNAFQLLQTKPLIGPGFGPDRSDVAESQAVMLGHALWSRRFGSDPEIVGKTIRLDGDSRTVVGVMPEGFVFPQGEEAWVPLRTQPDSARAAPMKLWIFGKLRKGVRPENAEAELQASVQRLPPQENYRAEQLGQRVVPFTRVESASLDAAILAVLALLVLVLLVAAANVASLLSARTSARMREMAVRIALGAGRRRIVAQHFAEALAMGGLAALLGLLGCRYALEWFAAVEALPWWFDLGLNPAVVAFAAAITMLGSLVAGLPPALKAARLSPQEVFKDECLGSSGMRFGRLSRLLLTAEVAISVGFLSGAAVMALGLYQYGRQDHALPASEVLVAQVYFGQPTEADRSPEDGRTWERFVQRAEESRRRIQARLESRGQVASLAFASHVPGYAWTQPKPVQVEGTPELEAQISVTTVVRSGRGYFDLLDVPIAAGRAFREADRLGGKSLAAIVNEPFVRKHFPDGSALGRRIRIGLQGGPDRIRWDPWLEIIGVIPDIGVNPGNPGRADAVYLPRRPSNLTLVVARTKNEPGRLIPAVYEAVSADKMKAEVQLIWTLRDLMEAPMRLLRGIGSASVSIGGLALLLSLAGLYAVMAHSVTHRTREIGLRMALGARSWAVLSVVVGRSLLPLLVGSCLGLLTGAALSAFLGDSLPFDPLLAAPLLLTAVAGLTIAVGLLACLAPARRALAVQPIEALREA